MEEDGTGGMGGKLVAQGHEEAETTVMCPRGGCSQVAKKCADPARSV